MKPPLRLQAEQPEDLEVLAAHLQDAIVQVADMAYLPKHNRFVLSLNRFKWEELNPETGKPEFGWRYHRTNAGLHFDSVRAARARGIEQSNRGAFLNLLEISFEPGQDAEGTIELLFSGGASLALDVECVDAYLSDQGTPWVTKNKPAHDGPARAGDM